MGLILLAGLAAVTFVADRDGGAAVPGLVLLELPGLAEPDLGRLAARWGGGGVERVPAGAEPLAPFDVAGLEVHRRQGYRSSLIVAGGPAPPEAPWDLRVEPESLRPPVGRDRFDLAGDDVLLVVRGHRGTRPFVVALCAEAVAAERVGELGDAVLAELASLPSYRRSSLVVLGARRADTRLALRVDVGRWGTRAQPALADLLDPGW